MKKILFLIHDLGYGGAEKVLVNLVNHMDREKFDITVMALFGGGVNEQFLRPGIRYRTVFKYTFPKNSKLMKLLTPEHLHRLLIREKYDIEVAYLEGPSARIISGCPDPDTKLVAWIHCTMTSQAAIARPFRSYSEAQACYGRFDRMVFVSQGVKAAFYCQCPIPEKSAVLYNTNESEQIRVLSQEAVPEGLFRSDEWKLIGVGKVSPAKGFDRLARICKRLRDEGLPVHGYVLGRGPQREEIQQYLDSQGMASAFTFLGYQTNPYRYVAKADLFVCASLAEGFSTAATEALIVGTPVVTTLVAGMKEMLGAHNEYGVVTENDEDALYRGIKSLLTDPALLAHYKAQAQLRGQAFSTENTVRAVEEMLLGVENDVEGKRTV